MDHPHRAHWFERFDEVQNIAAAAVAFAQRHSGQWFGPLIPHLGSCVRYARTPEQVQQALAETKINLEQAADLGRAGPQGLFQVYRPHHYYYRPDEHVPLYEPEHGSSAIYDDAARAASGLKAAWSEEISTSGYHASSYTGLVDLVRHMGGDKTQIMKSIRCFIELSPIPGFKRLVSADRRIPVTVCYPQSLSCCVNLDLEKVSNVHWGNKLAVTRENLGMSAQGRNRNAKLVLRGKKEISQFMLEDFAQRDAWATGQRIRSYPRKPWLEDRVIGERERPINAKRLVWLTPSGGYGGEWVFFLRARSGDTWVDYSTGLFDPRAQIPELWTIYNSWTEDARLDEGTFTQFLASFSLLPTEFYRSLRKMAG